MADLHRWLRDERLPTPSMPPCPWRGWCSTENGAACGNGLSWPWVPWEPRKNYPRLLRALAAAQARAQLYARRPAGRFYRLDAEIERLAAAVGVEVHGVTDEELLALHESVATIFASWEEGFGLPVLESLWRGLPLPLSYRIGHG